ncbi:hypothetical protein BLA13014_03287 [Burkholderia aenigmatica]|uniref:Uncharacterized protein n=1 Tax=Burkholderia aenigmatica TaxID=2015348 RepID=A0A6P2LZQ9_9BURK|nr:hypothetical protein BLA13014_03287 [Burkholderia aenigmatica]
MPFLYVVQCDRCGHSHRGVFNGDCRHNIECLTGDHFDAHFGPAGRQIRKSSK